MDRITKPYSNLSHSLLVRPDVRFGIQRPQEDVVLICRRHIITQFYWMFNILVLLFVTIILNILFFQFFAIQQLITINVFAIIFTLSYGWINALFWYFTVGIVTTERILDLDFFSITYKEFSAASIDKVSDLTTKIAGFFGSLLDYGNIFIKTEGFEQNIEFEEVPNPTEIVKIINEIAGRSNTN